MARRRQDPVETQSILFNGGVNLLVHPIAIQNNQLQRSQNMFPNFAGILLKRPGVTHAQVAFANTGVSEASFKFLNHFIAPLESPYRYISHTFAYSNGGIHGNDDEYVVASNLDALGGGFSLQAYGINNGGVNGEIGFQTEPICFVNYGNQCLAIGRYNANGNFMRFYLNGTWQWREVSFVHVKATTVNVTEDQSQIIAVQPKVGCVYKNRVRYFNFGPGMGNWMVSSDYQKANYTDITTAPIYTEVGSDCLAINGPHWEFGDLSNEIITCAKEIQLQALGNAQSSALLVLTDKSCVIATGDVGQTSDANYAGDFAPAKVNFECGCCSFNTLQRTPYGYIWAAKDEIWALSGNLPFKIGTLIQKALREYPPEAKKWWTAAYYDNKYILQVVSSRGSDDRYLTREQWWLDLSGGMPQDFTKAKWYGPMQIIMDTASTDEATSRFHVSGICTDYDDSRVIGTIDVRGMQGPDNHVASLVDYTSNGNVDDLPFPAITQGQVWVAGQQQYVGDVVIPPFGTHKGKLFVCTTPGTTGLVQPIWTFGDGDTVNDNTVTWTEIKNLLYATYILNARTTDNFTNAIDVRTKEFALGAPQFQKIIERLDIFGYASELTCLNGVLIKNQGDFSLITTGRVIVLLGQGSDLKAGIGILDSTNITHNQLEGKSMRPIVDTILRVNTAAFQFTETGLFPAIANAAGAYVIDATSNKICFGVVDQANQVMYLLEATIPLTAFGFNQYTTIDALIAAVALAINNSMIASGISSIDDITFNLGANPWFGGLNNGNYLGRIGVTPTFAGGEGSIVLFYGNSDAYSIAGVPGIVQMTAQTTFDLATSKRLMAMMGFSTATVAGTNDCASLTGGVAPHNIFTQIQTLSIYAPATIWGTNIIPLTRTGAIGLGNGIILATPTTTPNLTMSVK